MEQQLRDRLDATVGKGFNYKGKNITIEKYKEVGVTNTVVFTPSPLNFHNHELNDFLDNLFEPVKRERSITEVFVPENKLISFEPTKDNKVIKSTLMDTLEKLKTDPTYLPQAKAICEVTSVMVDIQKNEISMLNLLTKLK